jgi:hypothetical protein
MAFSMALSGAVTDLEDGHSMGLQRLFDLFHQRFFDE